MCNDENEGDESGGNCSPCATGFFKDSPGSAKCRACGAGSTSAIAKGATSCVCTIGWYGESESNPAACTQCLPRATTRAVNSIGKDTCECAPGYFRSWGGQARFIKRKSGIDVAPCDVCPAGRFTANIGAM